VLENVPFLLKLDRGAAIRSNIEQTIFLGLAGFGPFRKNRNAKEQAALVSDLFGSPLMCCRAGVR
jgi:hypothetical protein